MRINLHLVTPQFIINNSQSIRRFFWLPIIIIFSCTHQVQFSKTLPAEILLPPGDQQLIFISRFDTSMVQLDDTTDAITLKAVYQELILGLTKGFAQIPHIKCFATNTLIPGKWYQYTDEMVFDDSLELRALQQQYPGYFLLTLDLFNLSMIPYNQVEVDIADFEARAYDIVSEAAFTLWNPQGTVIDQILTESVDVVRHRQATSGYPVVHPNIIEFIDKARFLSTELGESYAQLYIPINVEVTREYYNGKALNEAANLIAEKQWKQAQSLLVNLTKHPNENIAEKAAYNLNVVYEALGMEHPDQPSD